jgi:hypothetical protein
MRKALFKASMGSIATSARGGGGGGGGGAELKVELQLNTTEKGFR